MRASPGTPSTSTAEHRWSGERRPGGSRVAPAAIDLHAVPVRAQGVELLGRLQGSGYREPPFLVRRADGQTLQLSPILYRVLDAVDGARDLRGIALEVSAAIGREVDPDDVGFLVEERLRPLGVLRRADGTEPETKRVNPLLGLRLRRTLFAAPTTERITGPFLPFFAPPVIVAMSLAFLVLNGWLLFEHGLGQPLRQALYEPGLLLLVVGLLVVSALFHEIGHATACRYGGAKPGVIGAAVYLMWPAFYTDVTDSYRLDRRGRLRVDLGGLYFNAIFAVGIFGLWMLTGWAALLLVIPLQLVQMLHQLLPLIRLDGYHILADLTGVPDLFARIKPTLLDALPGRRRARGRSPLERWARVVVTTWVVLVIPVLALSLLLMVVGLPRIAATAWDSLGLQWSALGSSWSDGDPGGIGMRLVSIIAIALPLLSITYLLTRISRRTTARVWRATEHKPHQRVTAVVSALALVAFLGWAWWPRDQYRPIHPGEKGTLIGAIQDVVGDGDGGGDGSGAAAPDTQVVSDASDAPLPPLPGTDALPVLELPSTDGMPAPRFVLFNLPDAPGPNGNQALVYNTTDGASIFDLAYSLEWVSDGVVDHTNEAYALATCVDCQTVVAAFQVILILGQADVVVPQNISVAFNDGCVRCITAAIAVQLVVSLTGPLSEEGVQQLAEVWDQLVELEEHMDEMTPAQIHAELVAIEAQILEVVTTDPGATPGDGSSDPPPADDPTTTTSTLPPEPTTTTAPEPAPTTTSPP